MKAYLCSDNRTATGKWFHDNYGMNDSLRLKGLPSSVILMHDIWPLGYESAHLLLWTKENCISVAISTNDQLRDMSIAKDVILAKLHTLYQNKNIIWFEHGPGYIDGSAISCGGCHVDQAHVHFVVFREKNTFKEVKSKIRKSLIKSGWDNTASQGLSIRKWDQIKRSVKQYPYLLVGMDTPSKKIEESIYIQRKPNQALESQFMRKIISSMDGFPETKYWHWRDAVEGLGSTDRLVELKSKIPLFQNLLAN